MDDNSSYEFNAPRYVDFTTSNLDLNDGADKFFDLQMNFEQLNMDTEMENTENETPESTLDPLVIFKEEPQTPTSDPLRIVNEKPQNPASSSFGIVKEEPQKPVSVNKVKYPNVLTEVSTNIMRPKKEINQSHAKRQGSPLHGHVQKFMSLAEGVYHYAKDTPPRFRTLPKHLKNLPRQSVSQNQPKKSCTIPQTPNLVATSRIRNVHYPTQQELEDQEVEEMKNFKLKAKPVSDHVLHPPQLGRRVERKSPTKIVPFNLTEYTKKELVTEPVFTFCANPVPKGLFEHPLGVPEKKVIPVTEPKTPAITKPKLKVQILEERDGENFLIEVDSCHLGVPNRTTLTQTELKPFTFDERDRQMIQKKEERIKMILDEEKAAREFRANPLPRFIKKALDSVSLHSPGSANTTASSLKCNGETDQSTSFKARPASVIHKEPFIPRKPERPPLTPEELVLHTEKRAEVRKLFEEKLQEKEYQCKFYLQKLKEEEERKAAGEVARLRREAVHKANPMPNFKSPVINLPRKSPTHPRSPNFSDRFQK